MNCVVVFCGLAVWGGVLILGLSLNSCANKQTTPFSPMTTIKAFDVPAGASTNCGGWVYLGNCQLESICPPVSNGTSCTVIGFVGTSGTVTPVESPGSPTPSATGTPPTNTPTPNSSITPNPSDTPLPTVSGTITPGTDTPTPNASITPEPTDTPETETPTVPITNTPNVTNTDTPVPTDTLVPTNTPIPTNTSVPTPNPTVCQGCHDALHEQEKNIASDAADDKIDSTNLCNDVCLGIGQCLADCYEAAETVEFVKTSVETLAALDEFNDCYDTNHCD
jgi:hypothetical protein